MEAQLERGDESHRLLYVFRVSQLDIKSQGLTISHLQGFNHKKKQTHFTASPITTAIKITPVTIAKQTTTTTTKIPKQYPKTITTILGINRRTIKRQTPWKKTVLQLNIRRWDNSLETEEVVFLVYIQLIQPHYSLSQVLHTQNHHSPTQSIQALQVWNINQKQPNQLSLQVCQFPVLVHSQR